MKWIKLSIISGFSIFLDTKEPELISTFSIVARDSQTGEWGVAVQSKLVAVGAIVPYAEAGVGAIATQAWGNPSFGPIGLKLLKSGKNAQAALNLMIDADPRRSHRQIAIIGEEGNASIHTGMNCLDWAGHKTGPGYAVQGNLLAGPQVIQAMAAAFEDSKGTLAEKMIASLREAQKMGGDKRGRQAAAMLVVRKGWGYGGLNDRFRDLRVDDHAEPIEELDRIYQIHRTTFPRPDEK
ncbi:MAG: hypothetical protein CML14_03170 [Puniceicoccaceae bacterium]|nr:hypothetical protein [Puniceicoccaceae bacterium]|tara:strand:- start:1542 stop:2255 length:714 start_codon:yes stop_codon:yes gene_type:complete